MAAKVDIAIIGGGPAGITTALALQQAAPKLVERLVVLEKETYPREKPCAGAMGGRGFAILAGLDVAPQVNAEPIYGMSLCTSAGVRTVRMEQPIGRVVRRLEFDASLARTAIARGIQVLDGTRVSALRREGRSILLETNRGAFEASVVVGCDGVGSIVRRSMGLGRGRLLAQALEVDTEPISSDHSRSILRFDASDRRLSGYAWDFATRVEGKELVCRGIYQLRLAPGQPEIRDLLAERLHAMGLDLSRYKMKRYSERGFDTEDSVADESCMLVGEAAGIDPLTGEGIAQAVEYGAMAGAFLAQVAAGRRKVAFWNRFVRRSRLGIDLRIRRFLAAQLFGNLRPRAEQLLVETPHVLHAGCLHFAGARQDHRMLASLLLRVGAALARDREWLSW